MTTARFLQLWRDEAVFVNFVGKKCALVILGTKSLRNKQRSEQKYTKEEGKKDDGVD
jgi:hypothetical protein